MYQETLHRVFGFESLRGGQQAVVDKVLNGQSAAAIFPTGSGKSLCYQLPALHLPHLTLVISPLLALMKDQLDFLRSKGIAAGSIDSSQSWEESQRVMQGVREGEIKILMISVERLKNERFRQFISRVPISLLVVDEAHCISEWGHNFRPDYLKLPVYRQQLNIQQVLLLTATATPAVIDDMGEKFGIGRDDIVVTGFYRKNLDLNVYPCPERDKDYALLNMLRAEPEAPTVIYVTLQHTAEQVAAFLKDSGIHARAYHAGMKSEVREEIQSAFMAGTIPCIVATIAFGMGVDKANIRRVIHFDLPKSIENYSQEIGRAGRDGQHSECTVLANRQGLSVLENFVYGDTPDRSSIRYVLDDISQHTGQWEVQLYSLSRDSNIRQLPLKTLLVYLELEGVLEPLYSYYADYRFKLVGSRESIVSRFEGERRDFVSAIFAASPKGRLWYTLDFEAMWRGYGAERKRVVAALDYFAEQGWIELESKQMTDVYRILPATQPMDVLVEKIYSYFARKEASEVARVHAMLALFESDTCLSHALANYFADEHAPQRCGHCSVCRGKVANLPGQDVLSPIIPEKLVAWCQPLIKASEEALSSATLTRFLCGIATPAGTKLKASKMEGYGKLENYPYADVLEQVRLAFPVME
ncbi:RecQ family ATP-dependent DNA helicase [Parasalinivibrio latis]|uniref:RecQ family ATP-dependent DNA helicase n=1 Tax=Parasalinivibrio latis TaxID=2952610 RepID=UPI0030E41CE0